VSRPCRWPDGGCGAEVEFLISATTGRKVVVDAKPEKRYVVAETDDGQRVAAVMDTYVDHHATCAVFAAMVIRGRAAKAAQP